ncbi:hypothetical protein MASR2M15_20420 [Anaerolineales bacterium]
MIRFFVSLIVGLIIGIVGGLFIGWEVSPVEFVNSPITSLDSRYQDTYTVMIATGFMADKDTLGAVERLRLLGVDNVPLYVQEVTERFITNSRDVNDIKVLVALSEGLGRLTPIMEPYRQVAVPGGGE